MRYEDFHDSFINVICKYKDTYKDKSFAVLCSGGLDSLALLFACIEVGLPVHAYTFTLDDRVSTDCKLATIVCNDLNVEHTVVKVPTTESLIVNDMITLAKDFKCLTKTDFECSFPMLHLYQAITEDIILSGHFSDDYFGLTKYFAIHFLKTRTLDEYKDEVWNSYNTNQKDTRALMDLKFNKLHLDPFDDPMIHKVFEGTTWYELNKPKIKMPIYLSFKDLFDKYSFYHSNYQCGDSGVREICAKAMLNSEYNVGNYKSATGAYNEIVRRLEYDRHSQKLF